MFTPLIDSVLCFTLVICYLPMVIYAYGRLNLELNYKPPVKSKVAWEENRNWAVILSITLAWVLAPYLWLETAECYDNFKSSVNYTLFKIKKDPLFVQEVEETPSNNFWSGENQLAETLKRNWNKL